MSIVIDMNMWIPGEGNAEIRRISCAPLPASTSRLRSYPEIDPRRLQRHRFITRNCTFRNHTRTCAAECEPNFPRRSTTRTIVILNLPARYACTRRLALAALRRRERRNFTRYAPCWRRWSTTRVHSCLGLSRCVVIRVQYVIAAAGWVNGSRDEGAARDVARARGVIVFPCRKPEATLGASGGINYLPPGVGSSDRCYLANKLTSDASRVRGTIEPTRSWPDPSCRASRSWPRSWPSWTTEV